MCVVSILLSSSPGLLCVSVILYSVSLSLAWARQPLGAAALATPSQNPLNIYERELDLTFKCVMTLHTKLNSFAVTLFSNLVFMTRNVHILFKVYLQARIAKL